MSCSLDGTRDFTLPLPVMRRGKSRPFSVMNLRSHSAFFQSTGVTSSIPRRRRSSNMFVSPYTMNGAYFR
jgi:hypothetical protein